MSRQKQMFTAACRFSCHRLVLNYFTLCEIRRDEKLHSGNRELFAQFEDLLLWFLKGDLAERQISCFRDKMIGEMEHLTYCVDRLSLHEYAMNRTEPRFVSQEDPQLDSTEKRINWTMGYILQGADYSEVNQRIRNVLEELPIRLTNNRFFGLLRQGLSVYQKGTQGNLDSIIELIRSQAFLISPEGTWSNQEEVEELLRPFEKADYRNMDSETFFSLSQSMKEADIKINRLSDHQLLLMSMVNDLYVLVLGCPNSSMSLQEMNRFHEILFETMDLFQNEKKNEADVERKAEELMEPLEGGQESCFEQWKMLNSQKEEGSENESLSKIQRLLSTSTFAPLNPKEENQAAVTADFLEKRISELEEELSASWKGCPRLMVRGMMAKILASLPIFFGSLDQLQEYVEGSLESCLDDGEAIVSIHLIREQSEWDEMSEQEKGDEMVGSSI